MAREIITFQCTECKDRNYTNMKNKKTTTERIELKKFCPKCRKHQPHREIGGEREHRHDDYGCGGADLLPGRPRDAAHLLLQSLEIIFRLSRPLTCAFHPAIRFHCFPAVLSYLAGAEGLEPPNAVLETAVLPLKLRP